MPRGARVVSDARRAPAKAPTRRKAPASYRISDALALAALALCLCGVLWGMAASYQAGYEAAESYYCEGAGRAE